MDKRGTGRWTGVGCGLLVGLFSGCDFLPEALSLPGDQADPHGFLEAAAEEGFDPMNVVIVGQQAWAVREEADGTLTLAAFDSSTGSPQMQAVASEQGESDAAETAASMGASNGLRWMMVAGRVRPEVGWVQLGLGGEGGWVHDGLYVIALPGASFRCEDLTWRMLDHNGDLVREGTGLPGGEC